MITKFYSILIDSYYQERDEVDYLHLVETEGIVESALAAAADVESLDCKDKRGENQGTCQSLQTIKTSLVRK